MGLGDMWHKTLVYFGIADEDEEYYEEETLAPHEELEQSYQERPNVKKVDRRSRAATGRRMQEAEFDDIFPDQQETYRRDQRGGAGGGGGVIRPLPTPSAQGPVKVHLVVPKNFNDAQLVADKFKGDIPVILNLQGCDAELSKRLIDFSSGLTYALDGGIERIADKVFLVTPRNVEVSAEERQRLIEKGFFNQF
jgi:cell division inhibitor SepF